MEKLHLRSEKIENPFIRLTRMKSYISSKAFVALLTDRRTKYLQNRCSFMRGICTEKMGPISQLGAEKITFPLNVVDTRPDGRIFAFIE